MKCVKLRALVLLSAVVAQGSFQAADVQAGPILDFFFGPQTTTYRPYTTTYRPYTTYYGATYGATPTTAHYGSTSTANYGGACCGEQSYDQGYYADDYTYANAYTYAGNACDPCSPCVPQACQPTTSIPMTVAPAPVYAPAPAPVYAPAPTRPRLFQRILPRAQGFTGGNVGNLPPTSYRSQWIRVPVTYYRPTAAVDPTTGAQVTAMRPCTTTQWQLQRVPVTTRRPFLSRLFGRRASQTPTTMPTYNYGMYANSVPAYSNTTSMGCSSCSQGSAITVPSTTSSPSTSGGAITTPAPGGEPADQPPSFDQLRARTQGASAPSDVEVNRQRFAPQLPPDRPDRLDVKPVPDPDGARRPLKSIEPPPLLDPRAKTAAFPVRQAWAATPITWPAASEQKPASTAAPSSNEIKWDSNGWTSVNN